MRTIKKSLLLAFVLFAVFAQAEKLRQIAMLDLPGRPGFDSVVMVQGKLVIAHQGANTVDIFDPAKRRMIAQVNHVKDARGMAVDEAGKRVFIASAGSNSIVVLETDNWQVLGTIGLRYAPANIAFIAASQTLLITNPANRSLSVVPAEAVGGKNAEAASLELHGKPQHVAWDAANKVAYVSLDDTAEIVAVNPFAPRQAAGTSAGAQPAHILRRIKLAASQPTGLLLDGSGRLYVAARYALLGIDPQSGNEFARVPAAAGTNTLWLDVAGNTLYAAAGDGTITIVDVAGGRMEAKNEFRSEVRGHAFAYDAKNKLMFIPGGREGKSKLVIIKQFGQTGAAAPAANVPTVAEKR